jgi:hypothetical protein
MKVKNLLLQLAKYNQEADVVVTNEDDDILKITGFIYSIKGQLRIVINQ